MKIKIISRKGKQEIDVNGHPIIFVIEDKKYLLREQPTFFGIKRFGHHFSMIRDKVKNQLVEVMEEWKI